MTSFQKQFLDQHICVSVKSHMLSVVILSILSSIVQGEFI